VRTRCRSIDLLSTHLCGQHRLVRSLADDLGLILLTQLRCLQIAAVIAPQRDRLDACLIFPSMPAVLKLNKLGSFDFAKLMGGAKAGAKKDSPIKKFFGALKKNNDNFEEQLLKLIRTLPAVLKFLPSQQARDGGNYIQSLQYWLGGNAENLENLVLSTAQSYVPALKGVDFGCEDPQLFPEVGIWHPMAPGKETCAFTNSVSFEWTEGGVQLLVHAAVD